MAYWNEEQDTICALSSAPGIGGIALIRVSGPHALNIVSNCCRFLPTHPIDHKIYYGLMKDGDLIIDEVLVAYFKDGKSYTGQETLEISCHGNPIIYSDILKLLTKLGCRPARPGEFTFRAFLFGRIDLAQAEGVLTLIETKSKDSAQRSLRQLRGGLSKRVDFIEDKITELICLFEVNIDFVEERLEVISQQKAIELLEEIIKNILLLLKSYEKGKLLNEGLKIALVGKPNVGKSSILNALVKEERAIVTDQAGTTRDVIEVEIQEEGIRILFFDMAGIRETDNLIEKIGINKALEKIEDVDLVFFIYDVSDTISKEELEILESLKARDLWIIGNKIDRKTNFEEFKCSHHKSFFISAKLGTGVDELMSEIVNFVHSGEKEIGEVIFIHRHYDLLLRAQQALCRAKNLLLEKAQDEFFIFELKEGLKYIREISGKEMGFEIIERIFEKFCIGK